MKMFSSCGLAGSCLLMALFGASAGLQAQDSEKKISLDDPRWEAVFQDIDSSFRETLRDPKAFASEALNRSPQTRRSALAAVENYRDRALAGRANFMVSTLMDPESTRAKETIAQQGLDAYLGLTRPMDRWTSQCVACWPDASAHLGRTCAVSDKLTYAPRFNSEPLARIYVTIGSANRSFIVQRYNHNASADARGVERLMMNNGRVCGDAALGAILATPDKPTATAVADLRAFLDGGPLLLPGERARDSNASDSRPGDPGPSAAEFEAAHPELADESDLDELGF